jgi:hypothetical protein
MMPQRVMLDLESLGTAPGSAIVAIGAVRFDAEGITEEFYQRVDLESCIRAGLTMDASTVLWWMGQSDAARHEITLPGVHLAQALLDFRLFLDNTRNPELRPASMENGKIEVWGNGASFDNALLAAAYRAIGDAQPWSFTKDRCYRTMKATRPDIQIARAGVLHNALDDARSQALHLIAIEKGAKS